MGERWSRPTWGPVLAGSLVCLSGCAARAVRGPALVSPPDAAGGPPRRIVLDAGHGGHDPGATHFGLTEKQLALDITRRVRDLLTRDGLSVAMTRDADVFVPLSQRPAVANRLHADYFVSVHLNAHLERSVSGAEVYFPRSSVVSPAAGWPPGVDSADLAEASTTVRHILWDLVLTQARAASQRTARAICAAMGDQLQVPCRVKPARFVVLREAWMPAVLVEVGYLSHAGESSRLGDAAYREAAARAVARGIAGSVHEDLWLNP